MVIFLLVFAGSCLLPAVAPTATDCPIVPTAPTVPDYLIVLLSQIVPDCLRLDAIVCGRHSVRLRWIACLLEFV